MIRFNGSYLHCNWNICKECVQLLIHHKEIMPQYISLLCSECMKCLLAHTKETSNTKQITHLNFVKKIDRMPYKPISFGPVKKKRILKLIQ